MGTVFMAEQTQPVRRTVALKLIKTGMDSRQVLARFGAERQALALMDHPNIAKVFDAGTTDTGRPYFVMELVKGIPITRFCDERRLTLRERLELAIPVCQAVQHAHQKGIIHRDLKPSNVLIALYDGKPVPKVIDFGVAKATGPRLTDQTLYTEFGAVVGTLEYMSPEQAELNQLDIDTRSDIYSLGVLLYELLTGSTPLERRRLKEVLFLELLRVIREEESPRPSMRLSTTEELPNIAACRHIEPRKLSGLVRGELDWIVMKALEKDRNRRYETANGLAADLRRYLDDEPVQACPPSAWYRFGKFARRNKVALTMSAVLMLAATLVAGSIGWSVRDRAARRTTLEQQAVLALDEAQAQLDRGAWPEALSSVRRAQGILGGGGSPRLIARIAQRRMDLELVARLEEIRLVPLTVKGSDLDGDNAGAIAAYEAAYREFGLPMTDLAIDEAAQRVAASPIRPFLLAALDSWAGLDPEGRTRLVSIAQRADNDAWRMKYREAILRVDRPALLQLSLLPESLAQSPATLVLLGDLLSRFDRPAAVKLLGQAQHLHPADLSINFRIASVLESMEPPRTENAIGYYRAAVAIRPESAGLRNNLGSALLKKGELDEAIVEYRAAIQLKPDLAGAHSNLGAALRIKGEFDAATAECREAIRLNPDFPSAHNNLGLILQARGKLEEAVGEQREAIRLKPDHAQAHNNLGIALRHQGKLDDAIVAHREAIRLKPTNAANHESLGTTLSEQLRLDAAIAEYREAIRLDPDFGPCHRNLGLALGKNGQLDAAIAEFRAAIRFGPKYAAAHSDLGVTLGAQGKLDEAFNEFREAIRLEPNYIEAWRGRASVYQLVSRLTEARADLEHALTLAPDDPALNNDLAWLLANDPKAGDRDPKRAVRLAARAVELAPGVEAFWNTFGVARYRAGNWKAAIEALTKSMELGKEGAGLDWLFLAMAHWQLGDKTQARSWYDKAVPWLEKNQPKNEELIRYRDEAGALLRVNSKR